MAAVAVSVLSDWFVPRVRVAARDWFVWALEKAQREGCAGDSFAVAWSGAGRRLGRDPIVVRPLEAEELRTAGAAFVPDGWGADELGRALLLLAAAAPGDEFAVKVDELFRLGEMREQQAILRVLAFLPEPERYQALASDAVRINVVTVIEALACDNPYPARHMGELAFNQMVMKAVFNELSLARVRGLRERNNDELRRIVKDFAAERRAAGRVVPADLALIAAV
jgi:hypothetical protein